MGGRNRVLEFGPQARVNHQQLRQGEQIKIDLKNATPKVCQNQIQNITDLHTHLCGCEFFIPVIKLYTISALVSPTGQELTAQQPVLICQKCGKVVE